MHNLDPVFFPEDQQVSKETGVDLGAFRKIWNIISSLESHSWILWTFRNCFKLIELKFPGFVIGNYSTKGKVTKCTLILKWQCSRTKESYDTEFFQPPMTQRTVLHNTHLFTPEISNNTFNLSQNWKWTVNDVTAKGPFEGSWDVITAILGMFHLERPLRSCKLKFEGSFQLKFRPQKL